MNPSQLARFFPKVVVREGECWEWVAAKGKNGYGMMKLGGGIVVPVYAHRLSYEHFVGRIPDGMQIDHLCRNRACVNPDHLEVVSPAENSKRGSSSRTHCKNGHPRTPENIYAWNGGKTCKLCIRDQYQKHRHKRIAYLRNRRADASEATGATLGPPNPPTGDAPTPQRRRASQ